MRQILPVSLAVLFALQSAAFGQEADRFVGTWLAPKFTDGIDQTMTITHDANAWQIRSTFSKAGKNVGASVGTNVKLAGDTLLFVHTYVEKPVKSWGGSKNVQGLRFQGQNLEMIDTEKNDQHVRTFKRTSSEPKVVAKVEPKIEPKVVAKVDPKPESTPPAAAGDPYVGVWKGKLELKKQIRSSKEWETLILKIEKGPGSGYVADGYLVDKKQTSSTRFSQVESRVNKKRPGEVQLHVTWNVPDISGALGILHLTPRKDELLVRVIVLSDETASATLTRADESVIAAVPAPKKVATLFPKSPETTERTPSKKESYFERFQGQKRLPPTPVEWSLPIKGFPQYEFNAKAGLVAVVEKKANKLSVLAADSGKTLWSKDIPLSPTHSHWTEFIHDGKTLLADAPAEGFVNGKVMAFDSATGKPKSVLPGFTQANGHAAAHPSLPLIAVRAGPNKFLLVELNTGKTRWEFSGQSNYRHPMFSERLLAVQVEKNDVRTLVLLDVKTGSEVHKLACDKRSPAGFVFSPDGTRRAVHWYGFTRACVRVYDVDTGAMTAETSDFAPFGSDHPVDWLPDGKTIAFVANPNQVWFCDAQTGQQKSIHSCEHETEGVFAMPDGERVLVRVRDVGLAMYKIADAITPP